ncbi:MAG: sodium:proton antiporter [Dehalococcoidia bacterium]
MSEDILVGLTAIIVLGVFVQWLGWRIRVPAILLLLIAGFLAGPVTGVLRPDEILGDLLFPIVSISVAIILFEGGMSLKISELRQSGRAVINLVSIGLVITGVLSALAAWVFLDLSLEMAILLGAILTVTGPTVIGPLLRHIRPSGNGASVVKWEGILNDPIGAILAVLVFEAIVAGPLTDIDLAIGGQFLFTIFAGAGVGLAGAALMVLMLHRYWVPDFMEEGISLSLVVLVFTFADLVAEESGLLAVTVMGIVVANQRFTVVNHILEFKENLRVVLLSVLFIVLAARMEIDQLSSLGWGTAAFVAVLILLIRPAAVFLSTMRTNLTLRDKIFVSWMAPRGIVAAAVTAVFAIGLAEEGRPEAERLVPIMFAIIVGTVTVYGLTAPLLARRLGIASHRSEGVLLVGANRFARAIAEQLQRLGFPVALVDTNRNAVTAASMNGMRAFYESIISDSVLDAIDLQGIGKLVAVTPNDHVNSLAALHYTEAFGRTGVFQLSFHVPQGMGEGVVAPELRGRILFHRNMTFQEISRRLDNGATVTSTGLTDQFTFADLISEAEGDVTPLFLVSPEMDLAVFVANGDDLSPEPGDTVISLVTPREGIRKSRSSEEASQRG